MPRRTAALALAAAGLCWGVGGLALAPPAIAEDAANLARKAEQMLFIGRRAESWTTWDETVDAFWQAAPMVIRKALVVDSVGGFGRYEPRADRRFASGERLTAYVEPVGYGFTADGEQNRIRLDVDLEIRGGQGIILASEPDFAVVEQSGRSRIHELQATIEVTLPTLNPGSYELRLKFRDASAEGGEATAILPFEISR